MTQKQLDLLDLPAKERGRLKDRIRRYLNCGVGGRYCRQRAICDGCRQAKLRVILRELGHAFDSLNTAGFAWQYVVVTFLSDSKDPFATTVRGFEDRIAKTISVGGAIWKHLKQPGTALFRKTSRGTRSRGKGAIHLDLHFYGPPIDRRTLRDYARTVEVTIGSVIVTPIDHAPGKRHEETTDPRGSRRGVMGVAGYIWKADTQCCVPQEVVGDDLMIADDRRLREDVRWAIATENKRLTWKYGVPSTPEPKSRGGRKNAEGRGRKQKAQPPPPTWTDRAIFCWQDRKNWWKPINATPRWAPPPEGQILCTRPRRIWPGDSGANVKQGCVARLPDWEGVSTPYKVVNLAIARARFGAGSEVPTVAYFSRASAGWSRRIRLLNKSWAFECLTWAAINEVERVGRERHRGQHPCIPALVDMVATATGTRIAMVNHDGGLGYVTRGFFEVGEVCAEEDFDLLRPSLPPPPTPADIWLAFDDGPLDGRRRVSMGLREETQYEAVRFATSFVAPQLIDSPEPEVVLEFLALAYLAGALTVDLDGAANANVPHAAWSSHAGTPPGAWGRWSVPPRTVRALLLPALERVTRNEIIALDPQARLPVYGRHTVDAVLGADGRLAA